MLFQKYKSSTDTINFKEKWSTVGTKEDKLIKCLENIVDKCVKTEETFCAEKEIF